MRLSNELFSQANQLSSSGYRLPEYDVAEMKKKTVANPRWVQLGAGNIFRGFLAAHQQELLNRGLAETGIIVAEGYDYEIVDLLREYDDLTINVTLKSDSQVEKEILASICEYLKMDSESADFERLKEIFCAPSLEMVSMTITEKGYSIVDNDGEILPAIKADFVNGPTKAQSYLGKLVSLLFERYQAAELPIALVSMDNMSHNGEKLQAAIKKYVAEWVANQLVPQGFEDYINNPNKVTFPWSMIDKITPRPDNTVQAMLETDGFEDMAPKETAKHTFVAPYVNGEETEYLIIEDQFPNGHPALEETKIIFTDRQTVNKVETMKVTTCLNPLHTALAIFGCLLGYQSIHEEMQDDDLVNLVKILGYQEGLPVVVNPEIIDPKQFIDEVIQKRLPNPFIPDTPQRIATDTSQKISIRFGETIKSYINSDKLDVSSLRVIPLVLAGWLRYLTGINDEGEKFQISPDPMLDKLEPLFENYKLGSVSITPELKALLSDEQIFGIDLQKAQLADRVLELYKQLSAKPHAVRETIHSTILECR